MIDAEAIAVAVLESVGLTTVGDLLTDMTRPVIRVAAAGGPPSTSALPDRLVTVDLQFDVWADTKPEAADVAAEVRSTMLAAVRTPPAGAYDPPAVVTSVTMTAPNYLPDPDWPADGRPGPRYVLFGTLTAHPKE